MAAGVILAGAVLVAAFIAATRMICRTLPSLREEVVYAVTLIAAAGVYVFWARNTAALSQELSGLALFGALALLGLRWRVVLAAGWLLHVAWDLALHPTPATPWVPSWYPHLCVGFDVVLAVWIVWKARVTASVAARRLRETRAAIADEM